MISTQHLQLRSQLQEQLDGLANKIADLRATGTLRMSKTGVKWCISTHRQEQKRLRRWLKELKSTSGQIK